MRGRKRVVQEQQRKTKNCKAELITGWRRDTRERDGKLEAGYR